jgi:hypothetical protein
MSPSAEVGELWAMPPAGPFARLVDAVAGQSAHARSELGPFLAFAEADLLPGRRNAFEFMLKEPFRRTALLAGGLALGTTGAGDAWLFEIESHGGSHRVFIHDGDSGGLEPVADGVESFAWLCYLNDGSRDSSDPDWLWLGGRVRPQKDVTVPKTVTPWACDAPIMARHRDARDLQAALDHGPRFEVRPPADTNAGGEAGPSTLVAELLRAFLREDPSLPGRMQSLAAHPARILRDAVSLLRPRTGHKGYEARLRSLGTLR